MNEHFIRGIRAKFGIPDPPQTPDIGQNSDRGISDFRISRQSLIKSNDIDMKLGPVTKLDKRNKITSKKIDSNVMSASSDVIVIFPNYDQFGPTWKPDSGRLVCKTYILITQQTFVLMKTS